jgi:hypothetical protein
MAIKLLIQQNILPLLQFGQVHFTACYNNSIVLLWSLLRIVQTGYGVHPTYPIGTGGSFSGGKAAGA